MTTYRVSCSPRHSHYASGSEYLSRKGTKLSGWTFELQVAAADEDFFLALMGRWNLTARKV